MINTKIREIEGLGIKLSNKFAGVFLLEKLLGGFEGKNILEIGCGTQIKSNRGYYPYTGEGIFKRKGIVYGLDKGFIDQDTLYLECFRNETGVIPIPGKIEDIDKVLKENQFDGIVSACVMGYPTKDLNWIEAMQKLYSLTKPNGYHCHFKLSHEKFNVNRNELEQIGFSVLNYFRENGGLGSTLVLHKGS